MTPQRSILARARSQSSRQESRGPRIPSQPTEEFVSSRGPIIINIIIVDIIISTIIISIIDIIIIIIIIVSIIIIHY